MPRMHVMSNRKLHRDNNLRRNTKLAAPRNSPKFSAKLSYVSTSRRSVRPSAARDRRQTAAQEPRPGGGQIEQSGEVEPRGGNAAGSAAKEQAVGERNGPL